MFPHRIEVAWNEDYYDCNTDLNVCSGGQGHRFRVTSVRCDGCDVLVESDAGFRAFDTSDTKSTDLTTLWAKPTIVGDVVLTAELEAADGTTGTATLQRFGEHVASVSATCKVQVGNEIFGACDSLATRPADSTVDVFLTVATSGGQSMLLTEPFGDPKFEPYQPKIGPDNGLFLGDGFVLDGPTAPSETVSWDGVTDPITITIPPEG